MKINGSYSCLILGLVLCVISILMQCAVRTWIEEQEIKGNQTTTTIAGGVVGAGVGAGAGAAIGGIGLVACGTGVGIPVGVVCLGLAALCGGIGAGVGHLAGKETEIVQVAHSAPLFPSWLWISVLIIGLILVFGSSFRIYQDRHPKLSSNEE